MLVFQKASVVNFSFASTLRTAALALSVAALPAFAQNVIKIGEINSYKAQPAFLDPYKKGMELAVEEINAKGGVNGKQLQLVIRDDNASPGDAVRAAEELLSREKVDVLSGAFLSHIGLALGDFAKQRKVFFLAGEPLTDKMVWQNGNRYTYRLRASTYMQVAMLVPEAAKLKKKRWAVVYPNYEYGQSAAATFKQLLKAAQPDVEFVAEQAPALGKIDAGSVTQAIADAKPDAIFNVLFATDLAKFVREGNTRDLFKGREVVSLLTGEPEYIDQKLTLEEEQVGERQEEIGQQRRAFGAEIEDLGRIGEGDHIGEADAASRAGAGVEPGARSARCRRARRSSVAADRRRGPSQRRAHAQHHRNARGRHKLDVRHHHPQRSRLRDRDV